MSINPNAVNKFKKKVAKFLESKRTETGDYTHLSMGGIYPNGRFNITEKKDIGKMCKLVSEAKDLNLKYSILEKPKAYGPVKVDIDLEYPIDTENITKNSNRLYNKKMVAETIKLYKDAINKFCDIKPGDLKCCLFEKNKPTIKNVSIKDGFHIMWASLCLHYKVRHLIRNEVVKNAEKSETFKNFSNSINDIFDKSVVSSNSWLMYGCAKPNCIPYELTKYYDHKKNELAISSFGKDTKSIVKLLSLRHQRWNDDNSNILHSDLNEEIVEETFEELNDKLNLKTEEYNTFGIPTDKKEIIETCKHLVGMLSKKRADNYHMWIRVGWALHNTDLSLLDSWVQFSKKSKKYKSGECEKRWRGMQDKGLTFRSLKMWAKEDSKEIYKKFNAEQFENLLKKNEGLGTFWIAKALHNKYFERFICVDPDRNTWYEFKNHRWNPSKGGGKLVSLMSSEFSNSYRKLAGEYNTKAINTTGDNKSKFDNLADKYKKIASKLMDITFKKKILEEAKHLFLDEKFFERLDENHDLIGFENGVYDLKLHKFREGHPDDYISLSTKVDYIKWNENNPISKQILKFFQQIIPNIRVRNYFLTVLSTCLTGDNDQEKIYFATGSGSNGKSVTFDLLSNSIGDYYISCPITILTRKRGMSGQATPELARFKGRRMGVFQEPDTGETFNVGILKELTGNDKFMARQLHQDPIEVKPQIKLFMACNELPDVPSTDGGTWRRIRVIRFNSKFVEPQLLDPTKDNMFLIDMTLKHKLPEWGPIFAGYLLWIYKTKYSTGKIVEPNEVVQATNNYRKENDNMREYFDARILETNNAKDIIGKRSIWKDFKIWFREFNEGKAYPKNTKLYEFLEGKLGKDKFSSKGWKGIVFKRENENENDSDSDVSNHNDLDV